MIALRDLSSSSLGTAQARQFRRHVRRFPDEQFAAGIEQARLSPARGRRLLDDGDVQTVRPAPLDAGMIDPGHRFHGALNVVEIRRHEPGVGVGGDGLFDLPGRYPLEGCRPSKSRCTGRSSAHMRAARAPMISVRIAARRA